LDQTWQSFSIFCFINFHTKISGSATQKKVSMKARFPQAYASFGSEVYQLEKVSCRSSYLSRDTAASVDKLLSQWHAQSWCSPCLRPNTWEGLFQSIASISSLGRYIYTHTNLLLERLSHALITVHELVCKNSELYFTVLILSYYATLSCWWRVFINVLLLDLSKTQWEMQIR
jgi:hypothetical protein